MLFVVTNAPNQAESTVETALSDGAVQAGSAGIASILTTTALLVSDGDADAQKSGSVFRLPPEEVDAIVLKAPFPLLMNDNFGLCWLALLANRAKVVIVGLPEKTPTGRPQISANDLENMPDVFRVERAGKSSLVVTLSGDATRAADEARFDAFLEARFPTLLAFIHDKLMDFVGLYEEVSSRFIDKERLQPAFGQRQLLYTLMGVLQKGSFLESRFTARHGNKPLKLLDLGAGYGALAVEMALKGHHCTAVEMEPAKTDEIAPWLIDACNVADKVEMRVGKFDILDSLPGTYDNISFFGALLYHPREQLNDLLKACADKLSENGSLIIHEFPVAKAAPNALDFHRQFTGPDLDAALRNHFSDIRYYSIFSHAETTLENAAETVILLEAIKG